MTGHKAGIERLDSSVVIREDVRHHLSMMVLDHFQK